MNVNNKIVFLDGMFPAIFFPVGLPKNNGSCAFLTDHCLKYCPAKETNKHEIRALEYFKNNSIGEIKERILKEMCEYNVIHLYWFPWGDCLPELTDKITYVMLGLSGQGILQNGFTKNLSLWANINDFKKNNLKIGFHLDEIKNIKKMFDNKIVCCPDINVGKAELYFNQKKIARCCGIWCDWLAANETRIADCQECFIYKQGCFYDIYENKLKQGSGLKEIE